MPRGGVVEITAAQDGPVLRNHVFAKADDARLLPELRAAMDGTAPIDDLTPRTVQGYYTRSLAAQLGDGLVVEERQGGIAFAASLPGEAAAAA